MTILAITNPMAQQPPSDAPQQTTVSGVEKTAGTLAVQPSQGSSAGGDARSSTSYSGFGAGAGGNSALTYGQTGRTSARPTDATPGSVVDAQTQDQPPPETVDPAQRNRDVAASLPDPLPTSPFLRAIEG